MDEEMFIRLRSNICNFNFILVGIVLLCLYTFPNAPKVSIEEFIVPAYTQPSEQTAGNIYFDLKLRNRNKAIGVYYDDPFCIAFFYYPYEDPYQKYVWAGTVPAFYQGNGKTNHIRSLMGNNIHLPPTVVETGHVRTLLKDHLQLPSKMAGHPEDHTKLAKTRKDMVGRTLLVNFRIAVVINYRFKYWVGSSKHQVQLGANVLVDLSTGETVSAGSIDLVESAATVGGPHMLKVFIIPFLLIMCS